MSLENKVVAKRAGVWALGEKRQNVGGMLTASLCFEKGQCVMKRWNRQTDLEETPERCFTLTIVDTAKVISSACSQYKITRSHRQL